MAQVLDGSSGFYRASALKGVSDSKKGTLLVWAKYSADTENSQVFIGGSNGTFYNIALYRIKDGATNEKKIQVDARNSAGSTILSLRSTNEWDATDGWTSFLVSYSLADGAGYLYWKNTDETNEVTLTDDTVDLSTADDWGVGMLDKDADIADTLYVNGSMAFAAFWPGVYIDLSTENERRNLVANDGKPVGFGVDGSGRGGRSSIDTPPIILLSDAFIVNRGTGGAFTTLGSPSYTRNPTAYRPSADRLTPGVRWYDSDRSGFSYPRNEMVRERFGRKGQRVGIDERDEPDRDDFKEVDFNDLIDGEKDHEDVL